jgi:hypothetical protein
MVLVGEEGRLELLDEIGKLPGLNADRLSDSTDGRIENEIESGSITNRIIIIVCEILFVLFLLYIGEVIYNKTNINISSKHVHRLDAILYLMIALFMFFLLFSGGQYHPFGLDFSPNYSFSPLQTTIFLMGLMFLLILLYFVFNCIWLVKDDDINDFNRATYTLLLVSSLTSLIPLFLIEFNYGYTGTKTYASFYTMLFALGSMISGALMIFDPTFMTEYLYNTFNFPKDTSNNYLQQYDHVNMALSLLSMAIIPLIISVLLKGTSAYISLPLVLILDLCIMILSAYLLGNTYSNFSNTPSMPTMTTMSNIMKIIYFLLLLGNFLLIRGMLSLIEASRLSLIEDPSNQGKLLEAMICTKLGICCIACAQFLIGYYLYLPYVIPSSTNE